MKSPYSQLFICAMTVALWQSFGSAQSIADFEDVGSTLSADSAYVGADLAGGFVSGGIDFANNFNSAFGSWTGAGYSNRTSWTLGGASGFEEFQFGNDTAVSSPTGATGTGFGGSASWGVLFGVTPNQTRFEIGPGLNFEGLYVNNTQTTANILENGSSFTDPFAAGDQFEVVFNSLQIEVIDGVEQVTVLGSSDPIVLADGTSIVNDWTWVDLRGTAVENASIIGVEFRSTDVGNYGINTPAYVAIDNLTFSAVAIPEPASWSLCCLVAITGLRRRRR